MKFKCIFAILVATTINFQLGALGKKSSLPKPTPNQNSSISVLREAKLRDRIHEIMLSNAGVIPREFENSYPFNAYDWNESLETPEIKERYIEVTRARRENYLSAHKESYKKILCYLKYDSESYKALHLACKRLGIPLSNLLTEETNKKLKEVARPLMSEAALKDLERGLIWLKHDSTS